MILIPGASLTRLLDPLLYGHSEPTETWATSHPGRTGRMCMNDDASPHRCQLSVIRIVSVEERDSEGNRHIPRAQTSDGDFDGRT